MHKTHVELLTYFNLNKCYCLDTRAFVHVCAHAHCSTTWIHGKWLLSKCFFLVSYTQSSKSWIKMILRRSCSRGGLHYWGAGTNVLNSKEGYDQGYKRWSQSRVEPWNAFQTQMQGTFGVFLTKASNTNEAMATSCTATPVRSATVILSLRSNWLENGKFFGFLITCPSSAILVGGMLLSLRANEISPNLEHCLVLHQTRINVKCLPPHKLPHIWQKYQKNDP